MSPQSVTDTIDGWRVRRSDDGIVIGIPKPNLQRRAVDAAFFSGEPR
ncbi:MAG: hypothetical protein AB8B94_08895 [Hyphomicrobiales bacterium]